MGISNNMKADQDKENVMHLAVHSYLIREINNQLIN